MWPRRCCRIAGAFVWVLISSVLVNLAIIRRSYIDKSKMLVEAGFKAAVGILGLDGRGAGDAAIDGDQGDNIQDANG